MLLQVTQQQYTSRALDACLQADLSITTSLTKLTHIMLGAQSEKRQVLDAKALYERALKDFGAERTTDDKLVILPRKRGNA